LTAVAVWPGAVAAETAATARNRSCRGVFM
jgi:hypothetical protein